MKDTEKREEEVELKAILMPSLSSKELLCLLEKDNKQLMLLFTNKLFQEKVKLIRKKFGIPINGIRYVGVTDSRNIYNNKKLRDQFLNERAIDMNKEDLKKTLGNTGFSIKSRKIEFQREISKILIEEELPARYREYITGFVKYNSMFKTEIVLPSKGTEAPKKIGIPFMHIPSSSIAVFDDCGVMRHFIEVSVDTSKKDVIRAYEHLQRLQKTMNKLVYTEDWKNIVRLRGLNLRKWSTFFASKMAFQSQYPVDFKGRSITEGDWIRVVEDRDSRKRIKSRYKRRMERGK